MRRGEVRSFQEIKVQSCASRHPGDLGDYTICGVGAHSDFSQEVGLSGGVYQVGRGVWALQPLLQPSLLSCRRPCCATH